MKKIYIFFLALATIIFHGCSDIIKESSPIQKAATFTCNEPQQFKNEAFYSGLDENIRDYIKKTIFPKYQEISRGSAQEAAKGNYISEICYSKQKNLVLIIVNYNYQMMGGFSYVFRYDISNNQLLPANMGDITDKMVLSSFGEEDGSVFTLTGTSGEGEIVYYSANYDYERNQVYSK